MQVGIVGRIVIVAPLETEFPAVREAVAVREAAAVTVRGIAAEAVLTRPIGIALVLGAVGQIVVEVGAVLQPGAVIMVLKLVTTVGTEADQ